MSGSDHELALLTLATAIVHAAPEASLRLTLTGGRQLVVGRHPTADISPCTLRQFVLHVARRGHRGVLADLVGFRVDGLRERAGGWWSTSNQALLATSLPAQDVMAILDQCPSEVAHEGITAVLAPDVDLGVTIVRLAVEGPGAAVELDRVADWALVALLVAELVPGDVRHAR